MSSLFVSPKVLNFSGDRYELINLTLKWAKVLKSRGTPTPMAQLIEESLVGILDGKISKEEILAQKTPKIESHEEDMAAALGVVDGNIAKAILAPDDDEEDGGKKAKKKKKKD